MRETVDYKFYFASLPPKTKKNYSVLNSPRAILEISQDESIKTKEIHAETILAPALIERRI